MGVVWLLCLVGSFLWSRMGMLLIVLSFRSLLRGFLFSSVVYMFFPGGFYFLCFFFFFFFFFPLFHSLVEFVSFEHYSRFILSMEGFVSC